MHWLRYRLIPGRELFALTGTFLFHLFEVVKRRPGRFHLFNRRRFDDRRSYHRLRLIHGLLRFILLRLLILRLFVLWLLVLRLLILRLFILRLRVCRFRLIRRLPLLLRRGGGIRLWLWRIGRCC